MVQNRLGSFDRFTHFSYGVALAWRNEGTPWQYGGGKTTRPAVILGLGADFAAHKARNFPRCDSVGAALRSRHVGNNSVPTS